MSSRPKLLVVPDGMAGWPQKELGGQTPWEAADTESLDSFCEFGKAYRFQNIPPESPADSGVANMALLGYDPREYYLGRGALEALNLGLELDSDEIAYRCNLVTVGAGDKLLDYSAGNLDTKTAEELFELLNQKIGNSNFKFHPGVGYRGLLVVNENVIEADTIDCARPHDEMGRSIHELWPRGRGGERLKELMRASREVLAGHPLNEQRSENNKNEADMIWPWGVGRLKELPAMKERYGLSGSVVAGVDLINGLGLALGMRKVDVPGATGGFDTDMRAKANAAIAELESERLVFLHLEAPDEAGHDADPELKVEMIEKFDRQIMAPLLEKWKQDKFDLVLGPDHYTPVQEQTHVKEPVPFLVVDGEQNNYKCTESGTAEAPFVSSAWEKLAAWYSGDSTFSK